MLDLAYIPPQGHSSKFSRSNNFVIFVRCRLITKFLSTNFFTPMGVSIGAAMNHEKVLIGHNEWGLGLETISLASLTCHTGVNQLDVFGVNSN